MRDVMLHAFNWTYREIADNARAISEAGYGAVLFPPPFYSDPDGTEWWQVYQPKDYRVLRSRLGRKTELVEAMAANGCHHLINVDTSWQHYAGDDYNPVNLYAATKKAFEDILRYYLETTPIKAITLTLFDSYGPGDPRRKLMSLLRDAALNGTRLQMSPGEQLIDLVYIDDLVSAFLQASALLDNQHLAHARYCVSSGKTVTLKHLVALIAQVTGKELDIVWGGRPYRPREVMLPFCPHTVLPGWAPSISLDQGIGRVMKRHGTEHAK